MQYRYLYLLLFLYNYAIGQSDTYNEATFTNINSIPSKSFVSIEDTERISQQKGFVSTPTIASQRSNSISSINYKTNNSSYSPESFENNIKTIIYNNQASINSQDEDLIPFIVDANQYKAPAVARSGSSGWNPISNTYNKLTLSIQNLIENAKQLIGVPYKYGGNTPNDGLDCSGFVRYVYYYTLGIILPRRSAEIGQIGNYIDNYSLREGDLVFFNTTGENLSHLGIYMGNGQFIHAPSRGANIRVDNLSSQYWSKRYQGARRIVAID